MQCQGEHGAARGGAGEARGAGGAAAAQRRGAARQEPQELHPGRLRRARECAELVSKLPHAQPGKEGKCNYLSQQRLSRCLYSAVICDVG